MESSKHIVLVTGGTGMVGKNLSDLVALYNTNPSDSAPADQAALDAAYEKLKIQ